MTYESLKEAIKYGCDRNIIVYDNLAEPNKITDRLLSLMFQGMPIPHITHFYMAKRLYNESTITIETDAVFCLVSDARWDELENYFKKDLLGSVAYNDDNLIVAISEDEPLSNKSVMLGSY